MHLGLNLSGGPEASPEPEADAAHVAPPEAQQASNRPLSPDSALLTSLCLLLRNAPKLVPAVLLLDFLSWTIAIELPTQFWKYLLWRMPLLTEALGPSTDWSTYIFPRFVHVLLYLAAVSILSTRVLYRSLSPSGTLVELLNLRTPAFARTLWSMAIPTSLFVVAAAFSTALPLIILWYLSSEITAILGTAKEQTATVVSTALVVVATGKFLSRWFLIVPVSVLETPGLSSFSKSREYTSRSTGEVWLLYTIHVWAALFVLFLSLPTTGGQFFPSPDVAAEPSVLVVLAVLAICVVWHSALSVVCYSALCSKATT